METISLEMLKPFARLDGYFVVWWITNLCLKSSFDWLIYWYDNGTGESHMNLSFMHENQELDRHSSYVYIQHKRYTVPFMLCCHWNVDNANKFSLGAGANIICMHTY